MDLLLQRSGVGTVPGCTRAELPRVARRGSEVEGKSAKGDKPRRWSAKCTWVCKKVHGRVHTSAQKVHKVCRGAWRARRGAQGCAEGCPR